MIEFVAAMVSWPLAFAGIVFVVAGAVGMLRLPDLYTRLHAASVTDTGATLLIGIALFTQALLVFGSVMAAIKLLLIIVFTLFAAPTASHALAKTALLSGQVPLDGDGKPLLDSPEVATRLARSRREVVTDTPDSDENGGQH